MDTLCNDYPQMFKYLESDAEIVHERPSENAVINFVEGNESQLTTPEKTAITSICFYSDKDGDNGNNDLES